MILSFFHSVPDEIIDRKQVRDCGESDRHAVDRTKMKSGKKLCECEVYQSVSLFKPGSEINSVNAWLGEGLNIFNTPHWNKQTDSQACMQASQQIADTSL